MSGLNMFFMENEQTKMSEILFSFIGRILMLAVVNTEKM